MKAIQHNFKDFQRKILENLFYYNSSGRLIIRDGAKYSIMDQVKFVRDSLQNIYLPQIFLGQFLHTLPQIYVEILK